jgi:gliding motility-associated protein GldM
MSIPKEPRQLMINLMYLVLTALLALNVSAEIINAFFSLNKGINSSNGIVDKSNESLKKAIDTQVKAYNNAGNQAFQASAVEAMGISEEFCSYINTVTQDMIMAAGGVDTVHYSDGRPVRYKDKDVTTNMFITKNRGSEVEAKIKETRDKLLASIKDPIKRAEIANSLPLNVEEVPKDSKYKTWVEYKFKQMPVAAIMPFFTKLKSDAKTSETAILNYVAEKVGGTEIKFDQFLVAISPNNGYVIKGEKFTADVALAAFSSNPGAGVSISVNGQGLSVKEGVAHYETTASTLGKQTIKATASITNPLTKEVKSAVKEFTYEVGQRSVALAADKMNVIYIGVENPISVSAAGVPSSSVKVSSNDIQLSGGSGKYIAKASKQNNNASIVVSADGLSQTFPFRVKRIPDPFPSLPIPAANGGRGGQIGNGTFKAVSSLVAILENFDFEAKCQIQSFNFTYLAKRQDPVLYPNQGGSYNSNVNGAVQKAKPGDTYYFDDIKGRCPGDEAGRQLGSMVFVIK